MSMQKRALDSTSSGEPSQPKRQCLDPSNQVWNGSESNSVLSSCLTVEDVQREVRKGAEPVISQLAEYFQSHIRDALQDVVQQMESMENDVQKLAEAVELANIRSPHLARANGESTAKNDARNLRLQLRNKLSLPLFTENKLEGEGGARISVVLIDADTGDVVTSGPEASFKLDVVVLEGDFNKDDEENWAPEEFDSYVVKEREGKRPLLIGDLRVKLKAGVGDLGDIRFTDNSSWNRSKSFRIGLKVASSDGRNTRIREAKTDAFSVKEHRGQAYKKNHPPASDNEVWRLESIAKDGSFHKRLNEAGIHKVEQFLRQHSVDSEKLRNILRKGMTEKKWKVLLDHAKTCTLNGKLHVYHDGNSGITAAGSPRQAQSLNPQNVSLNQNIDSFYRMEPSVDTNVQPFGQPHGSLSSFPASNTGYEGINQLLLED